MPQTQKIGKHKTRCFIDNEGFFNVQYWDTIIFKTKDNICILNNGEYYTNTTKNRINQAFNEKNIPFHVYQSKRQWYIRNYNTNEIKEYQNNIILTY